MKTVIYAIATFALLVGCSKVLKPEDYYRFMDDKTKGPWTELDLDLFHYSVQYRPIEYQLWMNYQELKTAEFEELKEASTGTEYYYLTVASLSPDFEFPKPGDPLRAFLEFELQSAFNLQIGSRSYQCQSYVYEPSYNLKPEAGFLLSFNVSDATQEARLLDFTCPFNNKKVRLELSNEQITEVPTLNM